MRSIICLVGSTILCSLSYGGTIDPYTPDSKYTEYGSKFHSVVKICGAYEDGRLFCASSCLIDDYNFLTAAHVVQGAAVCYVTVEDISLPMMAYSVPIYYTLMPAEVSTNLARFDGIKFGLQSDSMDVETIQKYYENIRSQ